MSKFYVNYRGEFGAEIEARDLHEAKKKFEKGDCKISVIGDLWPEYFEVADENENIVQEMGWPEFTNKGGESNGS